jgi:hypothetical protein
MCSVVLYKRIFPHEFQFRMDRGQNANSHLVKISNQNLNLFSTVKSETLQPFIHSFRFVHVIRMKNISKLEMRVMSSLGYQCIQKNFHLSQAQQSAMEMCSI